MIKHVLLPTGYMAYIFRSFTTLSCTGYPSTLTYMLYNHGSATMAYDVHTYTCEQNTNWATSYVVLFLRKKTQETTEFLR